LGEYNGLFYQFSIIVLNFYNNSTSWSMIARSNVTENILI